jgi:ABC-type branched-subunit amino acid transport system ATPase component
MFVMNSALTVKSCLYPNMVNEAVNQGELIGVISPNGAGK